MSIDTSDLRELGRIVAAHGVMGEVKVAPETDDPDRFLDLKSVLVGLDEESSTIFDIRSARIQPSKYGATVVLGFDGIDSRDEAEGQRKKRIFVHEKDLPALKPGEYYLSDLVGLHVQTNDNKSIGIVVDVFDFPGQNVLSIELETGEKVMIPAVPEFLLDIDFDSNTIVVSVIDGMIS